MAVRALVLVLLLGCNPRTIVLRPGDGGATSVLGASSLATGEFSSCIVRGGSLFCWGRDVVEVGLVFNSLSPVPVAPSITDFLTIDSGGSRTCGLRSSHALVCLGANDVGQLGVGDTMPRTEPTEITLPLPVLRFSARSGVGCAILTDDSLWCWGANGEGQLAIVGDSTPRPSPVAVLPGVRMAEVAVGQGHVCAIAMGGEMQCWGRNINGLLGRGTDIGGDAMPAPVAGGMRWSRVTCAQASTCAIAEDSSLWCWGSDDGPDGAPGPLGLVGDQIAVRTPQRVGSDAGWTQVSAHTFHTCGVRSGELYCWGRNLEGQLGAGEVPGFQEPTRIDGFAGVREVSTGLFHTCVIAEDSSVWCTGIGSMGELGVGALGRHTAFTQVTALE